MNFNTTFANLNPGFADSEYSDLLRFLFYCMAKLETCPYVLGILKKWNEIDYFFSQKFLHKTHTSSVTCKLDRNRVQIFRITNSPKKCRVICIMCKYEISTIPLRGCKKLAFFCRNSLELTGQLICNR